MKFIFQSGNIFKLGLALNIMKKEKKEKSKDFFRLFMIGFLFLIILIRVVSAASPDYYVQSFIGWINSTYGTFFAAILGEDVFSSFLFEKILLLFIVFAIVYMSLGRAELFSGNRPALIVVSTAVSILAVRYIRDTEFIKGILLPYGAMGASIIVFLPLLIYFFFVHTSITGTFGRRMAWILYGVIFFVLWGSRTAGVAPAVDWIYIVGIIFVLLNILFDRSVHYYFGLTALQKWRERVDDARIARLQAEYDRIQGVESVHADRRRRQIERELRRNNAWHG